MLTLTLWRFCLTIILWKRSVCMRHNATFSALGNDRHLHCNVFCHTEILSIRWCAPAYYTLCSTQCTHTHSFRCHSLAYDAQRMLYIQSQFTWEFYDITHAARCCRFSCVLLNFVHRLFRLQNRICNVNDLRTHCVATFFCSIHYILLNYLNCDSALNYVVFLPIT